jgi:hypothetical protein
MIPNSIWQTYKTEFPPPQSCDLIQSWVSTNPKLKWYYMDDAACDMFIRYHFSNEFYHMYTSLPLGVMRADVWRVAVVYAYGGIYADIDTVCLQPITQWISSDDSLVVGVETLTGSINNFVFAAEPQHPALHRVLERFLELFNANEYLLASDTLVQNFGAHGWSDGILKYYNLDAADSMSKGGDYYNSVEQVKKDRTKFYSYNSNAFTPVPSNQSFVHHQTASMFWHDGYDSWRVQQRQLFGV